MALDELRALIRKHANSDMVGELDGVQLSCDETQGSPKPSTTGTVFALIAQGAKQLLLGDRRFEYQAGEYLVASIDLPVTGSFIRASAAKPAMGFGMTLRPAAIAELLMDVGDFSLAGRGAVASPGLAVSVAPPELLDAVVRLLRLLDRPRDLPVLAPSIQREILWWLVSGEQGAIVRQLGLADGSLARISRAVRWIREHHAEPVRVEQLAQLAGLSASAFHRNFQAVTAMSPIQFQKRIRLQEARTLLMGHAVDVAEVGYRVGYDSPSQFNREYRRLFGLPPGRDRDQMRGEFLGT